MNGLRRAGACAAGLLSAAAHASDCESLDGLRWLIGDWMAEHSQSVVHESWRELGPMDLAGSGITRDKPDGAIRNVEDLRLSQMGGGIFYIAKVSENELPVSFRLTSCADNVFIFENPGHDFPQRLEYRRYGENGLAVRVAGGGDEGFTVEFGRAESVLLAGERLLIAEDARFHAMIAAKPKAMERWFDPELEYVHSSGVVQGRDQLFQAIAAGRMRYLAVEPIERYVSILARDVALVHGTGRFRVSAGSEPLEMLLHYTAVYVERDGDWRLRSWQSLRVAEKEDES